MCVRVACGMWHVACGMCVCGAAAAAAAAVRREARPTRANRVAHLVGRFLALAGAGPRRARRTARRARVAAAAAMPPHELVAPLQRARQRLAQRRAPAQRQRPRGRAARRRPGQLLQRAQEQSAAARRSARALIYNVRLGVGVVRDAPGPAARAQGRRGAREKFLVARKPPRGPSAARGAPRRLARRSARRDGGGGERGCIRALSARRGARGCPWRARGARLAGEPPKARKWGKCTVSPRRDAHRVPAA